MGQTNMKPDGKKVMKGEEYKISCSQDVGDQKERRDVRFI